MSIVLELLHEVTAYGATLAADPPDLILEGDTAKVPDELKVRLREHKPELLAHLATTPQLLASVKRLEGQRISVAVWPDGSMSVVIGGAVGAAWRDGGTVYEPGEMFEYVRLNSTERKLIRDLKGLRP